MAKQQCEKAACPNRTYATEPERLVDTYADTILRVCYTYLRSTQDAEDICQDVLLKVLQRPQRFFSADQRARMDHPRGGKRMQRPAEEPRSAGHYRT